MQGKNKHMAYVHEVPY